MNHYFVTFSASGGLTEPLCQKFKTHFLSSYDYVFGCKEFHASGDAHLHILYTSPAKQSNGLTRQYEKLYTKWGIDHVKGVSIKNKRVTNLIGMFHYISKDIKEKPYMILKWKWTWIQQQCRDNVKLIPKKILNGENRWVNQREAGMIMMAYAKSTGKQIFSKEQFCETFAEMQEQGYQFDKVNLRPVYTLIMAMNGDKRPAYEYAMSQLNFL